MRPMWGLHVPRDHRVGFIWSGKFAARILGLAFGLALAVRPAGPAEVSGVKGGSPKARPCERERMRSALDAGGADPDNARRSGPVAVTFRTAIGALGASVTAWSCSCGAAPGPLRRGPAAAGDRGRRARQLGAPVGLPPEGRERKLPPRNGETPG